MPMRLTLLALLAPTALAAQTLVSTVPSNRTGLLEEFTAVNCGICPRGHEVAADLLLTHPNDLIVVGVHGGDLATPSGSQPDFRTTWGSSIWSQFGVSAQPQGLMNRSSYNGQLVLSRSNWSAALAANLAVPSPVNIGAATTFDATTRDLTVEVEVYYTITGSGANDRLHVLLTESGITGYQQDYQNGAQPNYAHQHVLRTYISPLWGDALMNNDAGDLEQRTYTFNVPAEWDIDNCHVVAYVGEYQGQVHNAVEIGVDNFSTDVGEEPIVQPLFLFPQPATDQLHVANEAVAGPADIVILDMAGRSVLRNTVAPAGGVLEVNVSALPSGAYVLRLHGRSQRFVVAR